MLLAGAVLVAACGDDDEATDSTAASEPTGTAQAGESSEPAGSGDSESTEPAGTSEPEATEPAGDDTEPAGDDGESILGPEDVAEGDPVKVGFISDGRSAAIDNTVQFEFARATVEYINNHMAGIAGRPIELVECETRAEPGRATDCANEMIQEQVALVIVPETSVPLPVHTVTQQNEMPLFVYGVADAALLTDDQATFALANPTAGLLELPIDVALEQGVEKVSVVVIDVPAATVIYDASAQVFEDAGLELEVIKIPPGQADMTPQMSQIAGGGPTHVHIIGDDSFCISAMNGLQATGYEGSISLLFSCANQVTAEGVGDYMEGVYLASNSALGDDSDPGIQLLRAIVDEYGENIDDPDDGSTTYITVMAVRLGLEEVTSEVTPETVVSTIKSMESTPLPAGKGVEFRCNGQANPVTPAVCTRGTLRAQLDADGVPVLPWEPVDTTPIPD